MPVTSCAVLILPWVLAGSAVLAQPTAVVRDFGREFEGYNGAFVLVDRRDNTVIRYHPAICATRFSPASTFKILNSLIGLDTGVIPDKDYVIRWDSVQRGFPDWNRDHTLESAIKYSVVWYYQELARRVGTGRMQEVIDRVGYGNRDISGGIDHFWLGSTLKISPDEQVEFLERVHDGALPFSRRSLAIVRRILPTESAGATVLHGKTGLAREMADSAGAWIGWYVGYLERGSSVYFFATLLLSNEHDPDRLIDRRIPITKAVLRTLHLY
jgi:beta-lactamase class D